jgi:Kef-type K+ transport system membrane component KefB
MRHRGRPLALALGGWAASVALGLVAVALLHVIPGVHAPMMVTIALTTTGLGTLLYAFFFVGTGIRFDLAALTRDVTTILLVPAFLVSFLIVRGTPVVLYRHDIPGPERLPCGFSASVASLGLVVVITQIGVQAQSLHPDIAQALIAAALVSMLVYPTLAGVLLSRAARSVSSADAR